MSLGRTVADSSSERLKRHQPTLVKTFIRPKPMAMYEEYSLVSYKYDSCYHFNVDEGKSSRGVALYVPDWSIHRRCCLDTPMWCHELMVHLAPPATQEESNALNNATSLERGWFSLARGDLAQTDILKRFEHLQADFDRLAETHSECGETVRKLVQARLDLAHSFHLYITLADRYKVVKGEHEGCAGKLELAKKDSALVYVERISSKRAQEKEKLVTQLSRT
nr:hypothetical protein [Tanacetum cinerariifolium]